MTDRKGEWMQTASGKQYWPLDPRTTDVEAIDIAHHLSLLCRYCGASRRHYSVAEHTLGVLYVGQQYAARLGMHYSRHFDRLLLLHDAAEAYCHDLIRPIKRNIEGYEAIEAANMTAIYQRFGIDAAECIGLQTLIKQCDIAMLLAERDFLLVPTEYEGWAAGAEAPDMMIEDARRYLRASRRKFWRRWSWWNKRAYMRALRRSGVI